MREIFEKVIKKGVRKVKSPYPHTFLLHFQPISGYILSLLVLLGIFFVLDSNSLALGPKENSTI